LYFLFPIQQQTKQTKEVYQKPGRLGTGLLYHFKEEGVLSSRSQSSDLFERLFCRAQEREKKMDEYMENEKVVILIR